MVKAILWYRTDRPLDNRELYVGDTHGNRIPKSVKRAARCEEWVARTAALASGAVTREEAMAAYLAAQSIEMECS